MSDIDMADDSTERHHASATANYSPPDLKDEGHFSSPCTSLPPSPVFAGRSFSPSSFSFPSLHPDGTLAELIAPPSACRHAPTPPAALSSAGIRARMANQDSDAFSESSLADSQYDLLTRDDISDISDISNNDGETASIASTDAEIHDIHITPEGSVHAELAHSYILQSPSSSSFVHVTTNRDDCEYAIAAQTLQSYLSEDLETPRQSTLADMANPTLIHPPDTSSGPLTASASLKASKQECCQEPVSKLVAGTNTVSQTSLVQVGMGVLCAIFVFWFSGIFSSPVAMTITRRDALKTTLSSYTNSSDFIDAVNLDHLLPIPTPTTMNFIGYPIYSEEASVRYQVIAPNHFMFTLLEKSLTGPYASLQLVKTSRGNVIIPHNATRIIPGVYDIAIHTADAHGLVSVEIFTTNGKNVTASHNFGSRLLHRQTYEKAGEELSKDLTVACSRVNTLKDNLQVEITAGVSATRNLTTQLALYSAHSVQSYVNSTATFLNKVRNLSDSTASLLHDRFNQAGQNFKNALYTPYHRAVDFVPKTKDLKTSIVLARSRALFLKDKFALRSHKTTAPHSMRKDLVLRGQQLSLQLRKASRGVQETFHRFLCKKGVKARAKFNQPSMRSKTKRQAPKNGKCSKHAVQVDSVNCKLSSPLSTKLNGKTCNKAKQSKSSTSSASKTKKAASQDTVSL